MSEYRENSPEELAKNVLEDYYGELAKLESVIGLKKIEDAAVAVQLFSETVNCGRIDIDKVQEGIELVEEQMKEARELVPKEPEDSPVESGTFFGPFVEELSDDNSYELEPVFPDDEGFFEVTTERLAEYENRMRLNKKSLPIIKGLVHFIAEGERIVTMDQLRQWIDSELDDNSSIGRGFSVEHRNVSIAVKLLEKTTANSEDQREGDVIARLIEPQDSSSPQDDIELLAYLPAEQ